MSLGKIVVLLIVVINYVMTGYKAFKEDNKSSLLLRILKLILVPGNFPLALFIYGFIYLDTGFLTFSSWNPSPGYFNMVFYVLATATVFNFFMLNFFPSYSVNIKGEDEKRTIARSRNRNRLATTSAAAISLKFAFTEELLFRFLLHYPSLVVITVLENVLQFNSYNLILTLPSWLTLYAIPHLQSSTVGTYFVLNLIFAAAHILDDAGKVSIFMLPKTLFSWFFGWLIIMAIPQYGFIGAMFFHFLIDFMIFLPLFIVKFRQVYDQYWNARQNAF